MAEQKELPQPESLTNTHNEWKLLNDGGTGHKTYFNKSTGQWLRIHEAYKTGTTLQAELKVLKASLAGFEQERLDKLVKIVDFEGEPAILSPNFGETLPSLRRQAEELGIELPPSFFKQMIEDTQEMAGKMVRKNLNPQTHNDEHIVCYIVDGKLRFGFLDPNEDELFPPERINVEMPMMKIGIFQLVEAYYSYSPKEIEDAPDLELADLKPLIPHIINFDKQTSDAYPPEADS